MPLCLTAFCSGKFLKRIWCSGGRGRNLSPNFVKLWEVARASPDCLDYRIGTGEKLSRDSPRLFRIWTPCPFRTALFLTTRDITPNGAIGKRASAFR